MIFGEEIARMYWSILDNKRIELSNEALSTNTIIYSELSDFKIELIQFIVSLTPLKFTIIIETI